jgi:hypothetical protein
MQFIADECQIMDIETSWQEPRARGDQGITPQQRTAHIESILELAHWFEFVQVIWIAGAGHIKSSSGGISR